MPAMGRLFVILNDNEMSIAPPVGAMSTYLTKLYAGAPIQDLMPPPRARWKKCCAHALQAGARARQGHVKGLAMGGTLFEELGFSYIGPIDGHDLGQLLPVLRMLRVRADGPVLIHAVTRQGQGLCPGGSLADKYHGVGKFDPATGEQKKAPSNAPSYTKVFANA
jgi:1-deoxy-D-xylulose-5-phosphate synthase